MGRNSVTGEKSGPTEVSAGVTALVTGGTIDTSADAVRVSPAAAVTGVILGAGKYPGQQVVVFNEAAAINTITFAVAGTSNLADGVTLVLPGLRAAEFFWNPFVSRWFRTA